MVVGFRWMRARIILVLAFANRDCVRVLGGGLFVECSCFLTELHKRAAVGGKDNTHPVEGIRRLGRLHAVDGNLAAHQEDEKGDHRPQDLFAKRDLRSNKQNE